MPPLPFVRQEIRFFAHVYQKTGNGFAIWRVLQILNEHRLPVPSAILEKLAEWANRLSTAGGRNATKQIAEAIEMSSESAKGGPQGAAAFRAAERRFDVYGTVQFMLSSAAPLGKLPSKAAAYRMAAALHNMDKLVKCGKARALTQSGVEKICKEIDATTRRSADDTTDLIAEALRPTVTKEAR